MLSRYIDTAMQHSHYEWLPDDRLWYGDIPGLLGVWAIGETEADARAELRDALEDWVTVGLATHSPLPAIDGISLTVERVH